MPDETVAFSEDEGSVSLVGDQDDIGKLLSADEEEEGAESPMERTKALLDEKKRRRREKEKERKAKACPFELTAGLISHMSSLTRDELFQQKRKLDETAESGNLSSAALRSPAMISEYLSTMQAKSFSKMSALELQDRHIPGTCALGDLSEDLHGSRCQAESSIVDTTAWTGSRNLDTLVDFIVQGDVILFPSSCGVFNSQPIAVPSLHKRLLQRTKSCGAPTLLFLTGAALRVTDVTRVLRNQTLQGEKGGGVAKLFAKHFKLEEHIKYLKANKFGSAVGTPGRVGKLLCDTGECVACEVFQSH